MFQYNKIIYNAHMVSQSAEFEASSKHSTT